MAGCKVVTRKLVKWHGRDEEFTNVYYFGDGNLGLSPSAVEAQALIDAVIAAEKPLCHSTIKFLGGAAYKIGAADTPGDTDAINTVELVGSNNPGTLAGATQVNPEMALDIRWLLGGRRYLRSLIHTGASHGYEPLSINPTATAGISGEVSTFANKMLNGPWPGGYNRIAPNGDRPAAVQLQPFLEHRQFHRYKRRRNAGLLG